MKNTLVDKYTEILEAKEQERKAINQMETKERAEVESKIRELEKRMENPRGVEDFTAAAQELRDTKSYLEYINTMSKKADKGLMTESEYKEIRATMFDEIRKIQEAKAEKIQSKLWEVIALMDEYTDEVKEAEAIIDRAQGFYSPKFRASSMFKRGEIRNVNPDKCGYWEAFCTMYFQNYDTAQRIKAGSSSKWGKR